MGYTIPIDLVTSAVFPPTCLPSPILGIAPPPPGDTGLPVFIGRAPSLSLTLNVTDVITDPNYSNAPAPSLDVTVETASSQSARQWRPLGAFTNMSATGAQTLSLAGADAWVRCRYLIGQGASFGFSVSGDASLALLVSAAQSVSGVGVAVDVAQYRSGRLTLSVSAVVGSLDVTIETASSPTAPAGAWLPVAQYETVTSPGDIDIAAVNLSRWVRARWTLSTGGSATFGISGIVRFVLATPTDRARLGVRGGAFPDLSPEDADEWLLSATATILGVFGGRYVLPLRSWEDDTREACVAIADWRALGYGRGTEPGKDIDPKNYSTYERYAYYVGTLERPGGWLRQVAKRDVAPLGIVDSDDPQLAQPMQRPVVSSLPLRRWGRGGGR